MEGQQRGEADGRRLSNGARKRIFLSPPDVGEDERRALMSAFDSNWIAPMGPEIDAFETELATRVAVKNAAALASGTAGLHLALVVAGVEDGDEVITSTLTFVATANAITYVGARPVFVDVCPTTWQLDPELVAEELEAGRRRGRVPKAVIAVDLYGQCADYDALAAICARYGVVLIEDAAESLGATYRDRPAGGLASIGVFSFNGNKIITTSGGGMVVSERRDWVEKVRYLATQARDPVAYYQHSAVGYNYRLSNLLAAIGRAQLRNLDDRIAARRAHRAAYREAFAALPGITFMPEADYGTSNAWLTCVTVEPGQAGLDAEGLRLRFEEFDIEARRVWKPMHMQPVFRHCRCRGGGVAEALFARGLCLPSGSGMTGEERQRVIDVMESANRGTVGR